VEAKGDSDVARVVDGVGAEGAEAAERAPARRRLADAEDLRQAALAPEEGALADVAGALVEVRAEDHLALVVEGAGLAVAGEAAPLRTRGGVAEDGHRREAEAVARQRAVLKVFHTGDGPRAARRMPAVQRDDVRHGYVLRGVGMEVAKRPLCQLSPE